MKVAIHQPEHFPYLGFFQKADAADLFVILDTVKFRKNYYQNRNKIKTKDGKDAWFTIPVGKIANNQLIKDVVPSPHSPQWREKLLHMIKFNLDFDASKFYDHEMLVDINMSTIRWSMEHLSVTTPIVMASDLTNLIGARSELLSNIVRIVGGTTYISGPSGKEYLDESFFEGIDIEYFEPSVKNHYSSLYNILALGVTSP